MPDEHRYPIFSQGATALGALHGERKPTQLYKSPLPSTFNGGCKKGRSVARSIDRVLLRLGYLPISRVRRLFARLGERISQIDEGLSREYLIDPLPGGVEEKIRRLCRRRHSL